jgi:hypothetical protein
MKFFNLVCKEGVQAGFFITKKAVVWVENEIEVKILEFLNAGFAELKSAQSRLDERTEQILIQVKRTNGRVNELEEWRERAEIQQAEKAGAGAVKADAKAKRWEIIKMFISATIGGIVAIIFGFFKGGK